MENKNTAITKKVDFSKMSFDDMANMDEKELDKQSKLDANKGAKKLQLVAKINQIEANIIKKNKELVKSLLDPTQDSVDIKIQITMFEKEKMVAREMFLQLFPQDASLIGGV